MKKCFCFSLFTFSFLIFNSAFSQDYLGFANSQYAGVNGIDVNPASIVNNPRKWDITLVGLNVAVGNNYIGLNKAGSKFLLSQNEAPFDLENFLTENLKAKTISVFAGVNVTLPSFMFVRSKHKDAFGFTCRSRVYANVDGIDPTLARMLYHNTGSLTADSLLFNQDFSSLRVSAQTMVWNEYGITYGKTISQTKNERLNVAGRLKLVQGLYSMYLYIDNVNYKFYKEDSILIVSSLVHYGHSKNLEFNPSALKFGFGGKPTFALDLGATYEFYALTDVHSRGKSSSKTSPMQREYRYKIGFSLQDLGWITYLKPQNARDFKADLLGSLDFNSLQNSGETPLADADDTLRVKYEMVADDDKFRMNLPTLASLQGDYYAGKNIYVNSTIHWAPQFKKNEDKIHEVTTLSITPRWDYKFVGAYIPVSYNKYSHVRAGASVRLGPIIFGTADLLPLISKKDVRGVDFHFLLKVPHISFKKNKKTRSRSKFEVNQDKPAKTKKGKSDLLKKDSSTAKKKHKSPKPEKKKKKGHTAPAVNQEKKTRKHIFPRVHLFKKKKRHTADPEQRDKVIYFKL